MSTRLDDDLLVRRFGREPEFCGTVGELVGLVAHYAAVRVACCVETDMDRFDRLVVDLGRARDDIAEMLGVDRRVIDGKLE